MRDVDRLARPQPQQRSPLLPRAGDVYQLGRAASPQFARQPIRFRVTRVEPADTADRDGWVWLSGYQLDELGEAIEHRMVFVNLAGLVNALLPEPGRRQ